MKVVSMLVLMVVLVVLPAGLNAQCTGECSTCSKVDCADRVDNVKSFYGFSATSIEGKTVKMSDFKGKVVLVVNTASKCGLTPQYRGLEALYKKYSAKGLVILGFPCNQFGKQEPGTEKEIISFCSENYGVTFPMFAKIDVNGENTHSLYKYLKGELKGKKGADISWNFEKFLIDREGYPALRFSPRTEPAALEKEIEKLLTER